MFSKKYYFENILRSLWKRPLKNVLDLTLQIYFEIVGSKMLFFKHSHNDLKMFTKNCYIQNVLKTL